MSPSGIRPPGATNATPPSASGAVAATRITKARARANTAKRNVADVIEVCFHKLEERENARHDAVISAVGAAGEKCTEILSGIRDQMVKAREEAAADALASRQLAEKLISEEIFAVRDCQSGNGETGMTDDQRDLMEKAEMVQDTVKLLISIELVDISKGSKVFMGAAATSQRNENYHEFLIEGAELALDWNASTNDANVLLKTEVTVDSSKGEKRHTIAYIATQGQGCAHDNVRNQALKAFDAGCPLSCPLNPSSRTTDSEKKTCAAALFNSADHKSLPDYHATWLSACHAAVTEDHSVAMSCVDNKKNDALMSGCLLLFPGRASNIR